MDPDLALVRRLHLELNGSGRRTRGAVPPPVKKARLEPSRPQDEALKDTSSVSISGSGSGSGRLLKREGTLRRLVKKQANSDSKQDTTAGTSASLYLPARPAQLCNLKSQAIFAVHACTKQVGGCQVPAGFTPLFLHLGHWYGSTPADRPVPGLAIP